MLVLGGIQVSILPRLATGILDVLPCADSCKVSILPRLATGIR